MKQIELESEDQFAGCMLPDSSKSAEVLREP